MKNESVYAYRFNGVRYDCGNKLGYLEANVAFGLAHPQLGDAFKAHLIRLAATLAPKKSARTQGRPRKM
jgi:UTP--glucose-1-phosphate uridylyltransferase